uniref:Uncharacterized protein n=1 Tax=Anguilla anguilla TaxID=7936 RepID=A0A0E9T6J2_ANGAN
MPRKKLNDGTNSKSNFTEY